MKIKTSELSGSNLEWAVAVAVGAHCQETGSSDLRTGKNWVVSGFRSMRWDDWTPSTDWSQGGPLIERFGLCFDNAGKHGFSVVKDWHCGEPIAFYPPGITHLIAACRAIVAAKLGDEVDVPERLV